MLLTVKELSQQLQIKPSTLYAWAKRGKIPCCTPNGLIRFDPDEIVRWLDASRKQPPPPLPHMPKESGYPKLDAMIARAKRQAYTSSCGRPDQDRATGKEEDDGSV